MQLGMVGLGRMGAALVRRLIGDGHECVVFDRNTETVAALVKAGATGADSLADLAARLAAPRAIWLMVPAELTGAVVDEMVAHLDADDIIIDGGNSYYRDDIDRAEHLRESGIHHVDVGTSGGVFGLERGFCLMIGGEADVVSHLDPIFASIAPGVEAAPRTPGRRGRPSKAEHGYLHCGSHGAGHFVKMVHNGVEYGLMAAYAEGINILAHAGLGSAQAQAGDAETAPLRDPRYYQFDLDVTDIAQVWRRGSVISSWLLDLTAAALTAEPELDSCSGRVSDSGEGRWTAAAAVELGVPATVLSAALFDRFTSQHNADFGDRLLSALRKQFGGHDEKLPS
ncbi:phosphogluconate dehydrogenase (NAD(+)-dependent, decarboxylating) [Sporichthya sp.]|uniref:phosphogluconate dehydrogenase (NAD(+)-dependent, decarboxylating) n=1 Tax=Sporichthya sp. TaxID=65475 RepID=UPI0017F349E0|nr:decarboxylating 6-phosphogluconate dehydrogenase [Sporichthya sp.]MBA3742864.1 decarboxylating 6-phosphogluconate dehydrogenase [Sporichthya sp.]